jgi:tetratricopeptide (TPR) repeat protein
MSRSFAPARTSSWLSSLALATVLALSSAQAVAGSPGASDLDAIGAGFAPVASASGLVELGPGPAKGPGAGEGSTVLDLDAPLWEPGVLDPAAGYVGRWQRELDRRRDLLARHGGRDHTAALALLGLLPSLLGEIDRAELVSLVDAVRNDRRRHPLVRSLAADLRGELHEDAGEIDEAHALYQAQGRLLSWRIIGPFDNANRSGHARAFGPELEPWAPGQTFEGKLAGEPLDWRPYEPDNTLNGGYVSFDEFLRPNEYVTAYATTWVEVPKRTEAVIHLGTGGAHEVWVGTELVGEGEAYRRPHPLQDAYAITLESGWNRVLVKVGCEGGAWGFYARISAADGSPIDGLVASGSPALDATELPAAAPAEAEGGQGKDAETPARKEPLSLRRLFEDAADDELHRKVPPAAELALTEFYSWADPFSAEDFTARDQAREADAAVASPRSALFLALAEDDSARARKAFEVGVERAEKVGASASAEHSQMLIELAYANANLGLERRAEALLAKAREVAPDDALIELADLEGLAGDGFDLAAMNWLEDLRRRYPDSATILRDQAGREIQLGRIREGLALLERYSEAHSGDIAAIEQRIDAHLRLGEIEPAVRLGRNLVTSAPGRPSGWRRLAGLEEAAGNYDAAVTALETAVELAPQDPALHTALGFLQSRAGDQAGSVMAFQRSLELNPQQPELRDLLSTLGAAGDDVFTRYAVDLEEVVAAAEKAPTPASWQGKDSAVLHRMIATRIGQSGLGERLDHRIIKILDERGIETQARHDFGYEPDESYVEVRRARVYRTDGRIEDVGVTRHYSVAAAGYRMYYDQRGVAVQFPGLRVGDVLEVAFVRRDVATRNKFDDYYGDLVPLQDIQPVAHLEYLLEAPADLKLHFNQSVDREAGPGEQTTIYRLRRDDLSGLRSEGDMPGWTEIAEYLHVSTYATWDEVGRWYWGLVEGQLLVDDAIRAGVAEALEPLAKDATELDKVAALYSHVLAETRYVGLEFGIHGYKPYRTTDIYNRKFGDCKDKASLLKVMLGEIGVDSHLVLVRTRDLGAIADSPASLSAFNHAIVYVPKYDLFMDGTAEHSGVFELPAGDQGASVVVIEDGKGASFRTIPYASPDQNYSEYELSVELAPDGDALVDHHMTLVGPGAAAWRGTFEAKEQRPELLTKQLARAFPGTEVRSAKFPGIDDVLAPVRVDAELKIPSWAQTQTSNGAGAGQGAAPSQAGLRWRVLGHEVELLRSVAPQARREHPLVLGVPNRETRTIHYTLPRGLELLHSPAPSHIESPFGRFELEIEAKPRGATVTTTLEFSRPRIEPGEYEAFREFLREVDAALAQAFEAAPTR